MNQGVHESQKLIVDSSGERKTPRYKSIAPAKGLSDSTWLPALTNAESLPNPMRLASVLAGIVCRNAQTCMLFTLVTKHSVWSSCHFAWCCAGKWPHVDQWRYGVRGRDQGTASNVCTYIHFYTQVELLYPGTYILSDGLTSYRSTCHFSYFSPT